MEPSCETEKLCHKFSQDIVNGVRRDFDSRTGRRTCANRVSGYLQVHGYRIRIASMDAGWSERQPIEVTGEISCDHVRCPFSIHVAEFRGRIDVILVGVGQGTKPFRGTHVNLDALTGPNQQKVIVETRVKEPPTVQESHRWNAQSAKHGSGIGESRQVTALHALPGTRRS